jgi:hypothetical protein
VYPENNREVMSKLRLESGQIMGTSLIYASAGCPSNVDNPKQISYRHAEICIPPTVSLSDGKRLTRFMTYDPYPGGEVIYT